MRRRRPRHVSAASSARTSLGEKLALIESQTSGGGISLEDYPFLINYSPAILPGLTFLGGQRASMQADEEAANSGPEIDDVLEIPGEWDLLFSFLCRLDTFPPVKA